MKKKNLYLYILILLVIVTGIVVLVNYRSSQKLYKRVEELYNYFNTDNLEICNGLFNYSNEKVDASDVDNETKLCLAYKKIDKSNLEAINVTKDKKKTICTVDKMVFRVNDDEKECTYYKVDKNKVNDSYKKIFGTDIPEDTKSFQADTFNVCYVKGDALYCGLSETYTYVLGNDVNIYRTTEKIEEKGSELVLYDYFVKVVNQECYDSYTTSDANSKCTSNLKNTKDIKYKFLKKNGTLYKHIFKKDSNGEIHWESSEPVKSE